MNTFYLCISIDLKFDLDGHFLYLDLMSPFMTYLDGSDNSPALCMDTLYYVHIFDFETGCLFKCDIPFIVHNINDEEFADRIFRACVLGGLNEIVLMITDQLSSEVGSGTIHDLYVDYKAHAPLHPADFTLTCV